MSTSPPTDCELGVSPKPLRLVDIVSALSYALDLVEGQPAGHAVRTCLIGLRIAEHIHMQERDRRNLYFALLLKDAGCSSNATRMCQIVGGDEISAKAAVKLTDWTRAGMEGLIYAWRYIAPGAPLIAKIRRIGTMAINKKPQAKELVQIRCDRGAAIAREMGFSEATAEAVRCLDEHWCGQGYPDGLKGEEIPILARILNLSQTLEVYWRERGADAAIVVALERAKRWFDPRLSKAAKSLHAQGELFKDLDRPDMLQAMLLDLQPAQDSLPVTGERIDEICSAFATVVDAKSPFTFRHSLGVTSAALSMSQRLGFGIEAQTAIRRAALLHDAGKLNVPNSILEKPGKLDADEWTIIRNHPHHTFQILRRIPGFGELAEIAASHHEKLDGTGYWRGLTAQQMPLPARLLAVADIYDALAAERPYRSALPREKVFSIIDEHVPHALDADCVQALKDGVSSGDMEMISSLRKLQMAIHRHQMQATEPVKDPV
jgi:putative nucleotidyltransferase with HDIG domain